MNFDALKREIDRRNISIRQLAILSGIVPQSLYAAMKGRVEFWPGWKSRIADALEMNIDELFPEEE